MAGNLAGNNTLESSLGNLPEWELSDLYPSIDCSEYKNDMALSLSEAKSFEAAYAGKLDEYAKSNFEKLAAAIKAYEVIEERMGRILSFAVLVYTGETTDPIKAKFYGDAQEKITTASSHLLFFALELNRIENEIIDKALNACDALEYYRPWLEDLRKDKPHQLEDRIEQLFHDKSVSGRSAWNRLFDETMASLRFNLEGEELSVEPALNMLQDRDGRKRETAAKEIGKVLSENARVFTLITNTLAKDKEISDRWRGFEDVADSRHLSNRIEREVVNALVSSVEKSFPDISHRYYALKAKWLGKDKLQQWDRNAPLPSNKEKIYSWDEARDIVLDAYAGFSPEMSEIAQQFFDKNWIDAPVRDGKSPGAFAHPTVPSVHPYLMLNYLGKPRDVMTLAHELGHGVHQVLAAKQGALMAPTPLTLAETASVFGEMLTFRSLLKRAETKAERKILLARKVEDMLNTVVRQISFYMFEREVHEKRGKGELTTEVIGDIWIDIQKKSLGPIFEFDDAYRSFWSYIPHFIHSPFYVYAYAFGDCLVNSLYAVYQDADDGFQERYFEMLKAGGTKHHSQLLKPFGLDASDPDFWYKGLSVISGMIDELESLD